MYARFIYRLFDFLAVSAVLWTGCERPPGSKTTPLAPAAKPAVVIPRDSPPVQRATPPADVPNYHPDEQEAILALKPLGATIPLNAAGRAEKVYLGRSKKVTDADLVHLKALTDVNELKLSFTGISDASLDNLAHLSELEVLSLHDTQVTGEGLVHLQQLPLLSKLYLGKTSISDDGLALLSQMPQLQELYLSHTKITDQGLKHLSGLENLVYLDLSWTGISDAGLVHLQGLTNLRQIDLHESKVTDEGLQYLQKALPTIDTIDR